MDSQGAFVIGVLILCYRTVPCWGGLLVPAIFNFGDSTTDTGTNTYLPNPAFLANFTPYGETYFNMPTGRFGDGRLTVDFVAQALSIPLLKPFLEPGVTYYDEGINFASAGSGLLESTKTGMVVNIRQQVQQFREVKASLVKCRGSLSTKVLLFSSLFLISTGNNDIFYSYDPQQSTPEAFADRLVRELESTVTILHSLGGNKFAIGSSAPLGCVPSQISDAGICNLSLNHVAQLYNDRLEKLQVRLTLKLLGSFVTVLKVYDTIDGFIKNGQLLGFTRGSNACCGGGPFRGDINRQCGTTDSAGNNLYTLCSVSELGEYVFWDNFHLTEKAYRLVSLIFLTGNLTAYAVPYSIETLASL